MIHEQMYLEYLGLGPERNLERLSAKTGKSLSALQKMSSRYKWKERLKSDTDELKRQYPSVDIQYLSNQEILSCISRESLEKLFSAIKTLKVTNVRDAKVLLEIAQLAAGKPTEITQTQDTNNLDIVTLIYDSLPKDYAESLLDKIGAEFSNQYTIDME